MPAVEIVAAVIALVATAASTLATEISTELDSIPGGRGFIIENQSTVGLKLVAHSTPEHGRWQDIPANEIEGIHAPQWYLDAWIASGKAPTSLATKDVEKLSHAEALLLASWIKQQELVGEPAKGLLIGEGAGVGAVSVYETTENPGNLNMTALIAFFVWHRPGYTTYAGAWIMPGFPFSAALQTAKSEETLSMILDNIYDADNSVDSIKQTGGGTVIAKALNLKVVMTAGLNSQFVVEDDLPHVKLAG